MKKRPRRRGIPCQRGKARLDKSGKGGYTEHKKGAAGRRLALKIWLRSNRYLWGMGGYFFFACRNKLMIPMITRQNWKSSEYVSMLSPPPKGGERSPSRNGRANRLPYDWQRRRQDTIKYRERQQKPPEGKLDKSGKGGYTGHKKGAAGRRLAPG